MFPRIIFQTWKNRDIPEMFRPWVESWKKYNPDYEYRLYTDEDNRDFVEKEFPQYLEAYNSYRAEIYRCDFVRYLYLYYHGGIYADLDFECLKSFEPLLSEWDNNAGVLLGQQSFGDIEQFKKMRTMRCPNALMISRPRNFFWKIVLHWMILNHHRHRKLGPAESTGPGAIYWALQYSDFGRDFAKVLRKTKYSILSEDFSKDDTTVVKILSNELFYPFSWPEIPYYFDKAHTSYNLYKKLKRLGVDKSKSYAFTYWTCSWKDNW